MQDYHYLDPHPLTENSEFVPVWGCRSFKRTDVRGSSAMMVINLPNFIILAVFRRSVAQAAGLISTA